MNPKFEIFQSVKNNEYYFRLKAENGKIILQSEGYTSKAMCENGISSVKQNSQDYNNYEKKMSQDGQYYFVLKGVNGKVIGKSEMYTTAAMRDNGIESVKKNAPVALSYEV